MAYTSPMNKAVTAIGTIISKTRIDAYKSSSGDSVVDVIGPLVDVRGSDDDVGESVVGLNSVVESVASVVSVGKSVDETNPVDVV